MSDETPVLTNLYFEGPATFSHINYIGSVTTNNTFKN